MVKEVMDLHRYKQRFERTMGHIEKLPICQQDREIVNQFKESCLCQGISYGKLDAYMFYLGKFTQMLGKPIASANKQDIMRVVGLLNQTSYSEETKKAFKIMMRKLYRMVRGIENKGEYPPEVKWLSIAIPQKSRKMPEELLTDEEMKAIIRACGNSRDKALITTLAESGCRTSEVGLMKVKHVVFEPYGARITVNGKTGPRRILIVNSAPYLQDWINSHPFNDNPESYLWCKSNGDPILYTRISYLLKRAAKTAGIKKKIHLHLLRHSRATIMASYMSESAMKQYFGWAQGSKMAGVYVHMSGKDTDDAVLRANGVEIAREKPKQELKPAECLKCHQTNPVTNRFCSRCGFVLNESEAREIIQKENEVKDLDKFITMMMQDPEIRTRLVQKMQTIT